MNTGSPFVEGGIFVNGERGTSLVTNSERYTNLIDYEKIVNHVFLENGIGINPVELFFTSNSLIKEEDEKHVSIEKKGAFYLYHCGCGFNLGKNAISRTICRGDKKQQDRPMERESENFP